MKKLCLFLAMILATEISLYSQALTGTKTINPSGGNYTTFTAAINDLNSKGVGAGGVIFNVAAGTTYHEVENYVYTTTSSATNPVVFRKDGSGANPIIYGKVVGGSDYDMILGIIGSDYVTFDGIDLVSDPTAVIDADKIEYGFGVYNSGSSGCDNIAIKNCSIIIDRRSSTSVEQTGIDIYQATSSVSGIISNLTIDNVNFIKGRNSIAISAATIPNENIGIENCNFGEAATAIQPSDNNGVLIKLSKCKNFSFHDNEVQNIVSLNLYVLQMADLTGVSDIFDNKIHNFRSTNTDVYSDLIGINSTATDANAIINIYNNLIYDFDGSKSSSSPSSSSYWNLQIIQLYGTAKYRIYNNTVVGSSGNQHENTMLCWAPSTAEIKNNIFADFSVAGVNSYRALFISSGIIENNLFWIDESLTNNYTFCTTTAKYKFREWQKWNTIPSPGYFLNNMSANPNFTDRSNFVFTLNSPSPASNNGQPLSIVTSSLNGVARNATTPDIGAYEGDYGPATDLFPPVIRFQPIPHNSLPEVKLTAEITDNVGVTAANLWFRSKGSTVAFNQVSGVQYGNIWEFTFPVLTPGAYEYFVCAKDASGNIISNGYIISGLDLTSTGLLVNNPPANPDFIYSFSYNQSLSGNLTVGNSGTYTSLTKSDGLFNAINSSLITGNINVTIISDLVETGEIALQPWQESGAGNYTLSIAPNSADLRTISNATASPISIVGADRITIDGSFGGDNLDHMKFTADNANPIKFSSTGTNGCSNITIKFCDFYSLSWACIYATGSNHSDFTIENVKAVKGNSGIVLTNVIRPIVRNCILGSTDVGNTLTAYGISLSGGTDILVEKNIVQNVISSANDASNGIYIGGASGGSISKNKITNIINNATSGSEISNGICVNSGTNITISNNIVSGVNGYGGLYVNYASGIKGVVLVYCNNVKFYYNTVNLFGTGNTITNGKCYTFSIEGSVNLDIRNNIFSNIIENAVLYSTGGTLLLANELSNVFSNNIHFVGGYSQNKAFRIADGTTGFISFGKWQSFGFAPGNGRDLGSGVGDPKFTDGTNNNISLLAASPALNSGIPLSVTTDFNGNPRSATAPDIGAIEDNSLTLTSDIIAPVIDYVPPSNAPTPTPTFSATITDNTGVTAAKMWYRVKGSNGTTFTGIDGVKQGDNKTWNFTVISALTLNENYEYFICAKDASGNIITNGITDPLVITLDAAAVGLTINNPAQNPYYVRSFKVTDLSIVVGTITGAPYYISNTKTASVTIPYTITGTYSSNTFEAYLSTASGSFTGQIKIGSLVSDADGTINAVIPAAIASGTNYKIRIQSTNPAGIISNTSPAFQIIDDNATPVVTLTSSSGTPVYLPFTVTIEFNEIVSGFVQSMITVSNANLSDFSIVVTNKKFTVLVTPIISGNVTIKVAANNVKDLADNYNGESNTISLSYIELGAPHLNIAADPDLIYINTSPIHLIFTFDQDVTGFGDGDIIVTNGSKSNFAVTGSAKVYTADVTPGQGLVTISVAADAAQSTLSSKGNAASSLNLTYDTQKPGVSLSRVSGTGPVNSAFDIYTDFTEEITGLSLDKLTVTSGTATVLFKESGTRYRVTINPTINDGTVTIGFPVDKITDMANNLNTAAATNLTVTVDKTSPGIVITRFSGSGDVSAPFDAVFTFSEDVTGFVLSDISVTNGTASGLITTTGSSVYKATITPLYTGSVVINVAADIAQDLAGNPNTVATPLTVGVLSTGLEPLEDNSFNVYPNPSSGLLKIVTESVSDQTVRIIDLNGRLVYSGILKTNTIEVDLQGLPKGTYLLQLISGNKISTKKIILY
jgi:hypothetical protein